MDHRTIVSFFTCQLVWVNRYPMKRRNFSPEFKRKSAQLVVDQNYTVSDAAKAMDVGLSTMTKWVKQLRDERLGKTPKASPITPEQIEIRELKKKGYTDLMVDGAPLPHQPDTIIRWLIDRLRS